MVKNNPTIIIPREKIENKILLVRGMKVMLDKDIAKLYGVSTGVFNQAVKRNIKRFPEDFMFQLTKEEFVNWISQIVISNPAVKMGLRKCPYAFTEQGVAMLSSVLRSERAIQINIQIIRAFTKLREVLSNHKDLQRKIEEHDQQIKFIFESLKKMLNPPEPVKHKIGFRQT